MDRNPETATQVLDRRAPVLAEWILDRRRSVLRDMVSVAARPGLLSLAGGLPDPALLPTRDYAAAVTHVLATDREALQYAAPFEPLKEQIVRLMAARGVECTPDQILLTTGAQQGIGVAFSLLLERHRAVLVEEATYPGATEAWAALRPQPLTVGTDLESGMDVDAVETVLARGPRPAFIYTIPDAHNPYGVSLSRAKRTRLVELARRYGVPIVEDDPYGLLGYDGPHEPALRAQDEHWVIYIGTFSKTIAPALRLGWMVLPADLLSRAAAVKEAGDLESSALTQRAVSCYLANDLFSTHLRRLREVYKARRDTLVDALRRHFPSGARWVRPRGGFFVWVELPGGIDCAALWRTAIEEEGVAYVPGTAFAVGGRAASNCLRLSFATCAPEEIEEGIRRLACVFEKGISHA